MLYKLINKYYKLYINAKQVLIFLHGMELLSNKAYSKEIGLIIKIEAYIQYVIIVFNKVFFMNTKEKVLEIRPQRYGGSN